MNIANTNAFLSGAIWICCWIAGLFFLRFWRTSRDRFFVFLTIAFGLLGFQWLSVGLFIWETNVRHEPFVLRVLAFLIILLGIVDKNRRASARSVREMGAEGGD